ncbi:MAG: hypothetical protein AAF211_34345, partial [Myxococcota bacterium]
MALDSGVTSSEQLTLIVFDERRVSCGDRVPFSLDEAFAREMSQASAAYTHLVFEPDGETAVTFTVGTDDDAGLQFSFNGAAPFAAADAPPFAEFVSSPHEWPIRPPADYEAITLNVISATGPATGEVEVTCDDGPRHAFAALPFLREDSPSVHTLMATGGTPPYRWAAVGLHWASSSRPTEPCRTTAG